MKKFISIVACAAICTTAFAENVQLNPITVNGSDSVSDSNNSKTITKVQQRRVLQDAIEKTEVIDKKEIEHSQAATLSEAISQQAGANIQTGCSICGLKRVQLNGLTGDHTTILINSIPFNSTVSSFYGADAIGTSDIQDIQITRGAGASLTAPEAIGGTINIIPRRAYKNGVEFDVSMGTLGEKNYSILGEAMSDDKQTGILVSASSHEQAQVDRDNNGISESPSMKNQAISIMLTHKFSPYDSIDVRAAHFTSDVKGGTMVSENSAIAQGAATDNFQGNNINNTYLGSPMNMIEVINTTRDEIYAKEHHIMNDTMSLQTTLAYSEQKQDSLYEGADYANTDKTYFGDLKIDHALNDNHFLTYGVDAKVEQARSQSNFYYVQNNKTTDDFDYGAYGVYGQDAWTLSNVDQLTIALRGEKITTNWLAQTAKGNEIDDFLLVPRLLYRHDHTSYLTSRLSWGMGYRSPLSFFESEHGFLDSGFGMDISSIEKSNGATYSLAYNKDGLSITGSAAYTQVKDLAFIEDRAGTPTLTNSKNDVKVVEGDIVVGYVVNNKLSLSGSYEYYKYDSNYKSLMTIVPVEQRARLSADYDANGWDIYGEAIWVGSRDLAQYRYDGYDVFDGTNVSQPKDQTAPSYVTVDLKVSKKINKNFSVYAGAKNLFDYVQTDKQSPLFYDATGGFDSAYTWGPLRGRTLYAGLKATF
jgi:outer membrane receptor protein involved in Fe transport